MALNVSVAEILTVLLKSDIPILVTASAYLAVEPAAFTGFRGAKLDELQLFLHCASKYEILLGSEGYTLNWIQC